MFTQELCEEVERRLFDAFAEGRLSFIRKLKLPPDVEILQLRDIMDEEHGTATQFILCVDRILEIERVL